MMRAFLNSLIVMLVFTLLLGVGYPLAVTVVASLLFPSASTGSLIERDGVKVGAEMVGQEFTQPGYFWGRPSAVEPAFSGANSGGSNLAPTNPTLKQAVAVRRETLLKTPHEGDMPPAQLMLASASGLDPHISLHAALWQVPRVAAARKLAPAKVEAIVHEHAQNRQLGVFGEPRVNVLKLNLALDREAHGGR